MVPDKRRFTVILVLLVQNIFSSEAIQCYRCVFASYVYFLNNTFLCRDFDYSNRFIVDCPYSTFCMKKNTYATINGVQINGTERDCAFQKLDTQILTNGKWHPETRVEEPYLEGCKMNQDKGLRTAGVEHCYCRGELCNAASNSTQSVWSLFAVIASGFLLSRIQLCHPYNALFV